MADTGGKKGKKQEKKKDGAQPSSRSHKDGIARYYASGKLVRRKIRRLLHANGALIAQKYSDKVGQSAYFRSLVDSGLVKRVEAAYSRRRRNRYEHSMTKLEAAVARHEAERAAEATAKLAAEKKAKNIARAKKAAATRAANKAAKLAAAQTATNQAASV